MNIHVQVYVFRFMFVQSRLITNVFKDLYSLKQILLSTLRIIGIHIQISKLSLIILSYKFTNAVQTADLIQPRGIQIKDN